MLRFDCCTICGQLRYRNFVSCFIDKDYIDSQGLGPYQQWYNHEILHADNYIKVANRERNKFPKQGTGCLSEDDCQDLAGKEQKRFEDAFKDARKISRVHGFPLPLDDTPYPKTELGGEMPKNPKSPDADARQTIKDELDEARKQANL